MPLSIAVEFTTLLDLYNVLQQARSELAAAREELLRLRDDEMISNAQVSETSGRTITACGEQLAVITGLLQKIKSGAGA